MRLIFILSFVFTIQNLYSQVGIGTTSPDPSSTLHLEDNSHGILINRVSLINVVNNTSPVNNPIQGLLVYNTNAAVTGGNGIGFYFWNGTQWDKLITNNDNNDWSLTGNSGTNPTNDFIGTIDNQDFVIRTNNTEKLRIESGGDVGIGTNNPSHTLEVQGDVLFNGDFINQEMLGIHSATIQSVPFSNGVITALTGTTTSITITDGSGVNNSAVFISAYARVFGGSLVGGNSSLGGYFMILQRDTNPAFTAPTILTYTSGICYIETPNGATSASIGFGGGGHISYIDSSLAPGTYYYRLAFYPNGVSITAGTYDIYQRDVNVIQIKR